MRSPPIPAAPCTLAALVLGVAASPASAADWPWPVHGAVIERFRVAPDRFAAGQHRGIDIAAPAGRTVRSACPGTVTFAGAVGAGGRTVSVRCGALTATYQHLSAIAVRRGERLRAGARLGAVGRTGQPRAPTAHLHFGIHRTADRHSYVDPLSLLDGDGARPDPLVPPPARPRGQAPLGPVPPASAPATLPRAGAARHPRAVDGSVAAARRGVPVLVWVGLGLVALGLPGLARRRRRPRRTARSPSARARRGFASAPSSS
jgi:hypothetical protein